MWHPFLSVSPQTLVWWLVILSIAAGVCFMMLVSRGRQLRTRQAPHGMVSLQLADSGAASRHVIQSWGVADREVAHRSLCLDYVFVPLYTTALSILSILAARWFSTMGLSGMSTAAVTLAWGHWVIGMFDIAENSALLRMLQIAPDIPNGLARFASWCARLKFGLIMMAVLCAAFGLMA